LQNLIQICHRVHFFSDFQVFQVFR
jgi:hypothetical protein